MSDSLLLVGIVALCVIVLFLLYTFSTQESAFLIPMQILGLAFFLSLVILVPKVAVDNKDYCSLAVANSTVVGSTTSYEYTRVCITNTNTTSTTFYKMVLWGIRIFSVMLIIYLSYNLFKKATEWIGRFRMG